jgi:hypothetical protein
LGWVGAVGALVGLFVHGAVCRFASLPSQISRVVCPTNPTYMPQRARVCYVLRRYCEDTGGDEAAIEAAVRTMFAEFGPQKYIANLGSGLMVGLCTSCESSLPRALESAWFQPLEPVKREKPVSGLCFQMGQLVPLHHGHGGPRQGGAVQVEIQLTHSLKPPGFNPRAYKVKSRFQRVAFKKSTCTATPRWRSSWTAYTR